MKKILETIKLKWAEYLLETIVIVVGILCAFALNNWNENRKEKKIEYHSLLNLSTEFKANKAKLERQKKILIPIHENLEDYVKRLGTGEIEITNLLTIRTRFMTYDPGSSTVTSLISTGNIDFISNDSLKYMLADWQNKIEDFREEGEWNRQFLMDHYEPYIRQHFPHWWLLVEDTTNLTDETMELYLQEIRSGLHKNIMVDATFYAWLQIYQIPNFERYLDRTISLIEEELDSF